MHAHLLHNGEILPANARSASIGQVGLLNGWGVFSTLRVWDGVLFAYERHWARMVRDATFMHVPMPASSGELRAMLHRLVEANQAWNATLRVAIVRNKGGLWQSPGIERDFDIAAFTVDLQDWGQSVKLAVQPQGRHAASPLAGAKVLSWAQNLTFLENAKSRGFDEVILLNEHGLVSECTSANVFAAFGHMVYTPPITSGCLPGITREYLLEAVSAPGFSVKEKDLSLEELHTADSVFITSTTRECLAVQEIEGHRLQQNGTARTALQAAFRQAAQSYVAQAKATAMAARTVGSSSTVQKTA